MLLHLKAKLFQLTQLNKMVYFFLFPRKQLPTRSSKCQSRSALDDMPNKKPTTAHSGAQNKSLTGFLEVLVRPSTSAEECWPTAVCACSGALRHSRVGTNCFVTLGELPFRACVGAGASFGRARRSERTRRTVAVAVLFSWLLALRPLR